MKKKNEDEILEKEGEKPQENEPEEDEAKADASVSDELAKLNDKYLRLMAEYDNYRKRTQKEKESIYPEAKANVTAEFLPVLDNLERALSSASDADPLCEGLKMVMKQFETALKSVGCEYIEAVGQKFDPNLHNAVMHVDDEELGENVVVEEFQKGYKIGDRIVRHSMVKVAN